MVILFILPQPFFMHQLLRMQVRHGLAFQKNNRANMVEKKKVILVFLFWTLRNPNGLVALFGCLYASVYGCFNLVSCLYLLSLCGVHVYAFVECILRNTALNLTLVFDVLPFGLCPFNEFSFYKKKRQKKRCTCLRGRSRCLLC